MTTEDAPEPKVGEAAPAPQPDLAAELAQARAKADEYLDLAKRAKADFLNYQDRVRREREELRKYAVESFVADFLPALESLRHTLQTLRSGAADSGAVLDGVALVEKEFLRVLAKNGITPVETVGKPFDPLYHEAVGTVDSDQPENTVVEETRAGWRIHDRALRPASVRIARKAPPPA